MDNEVGAKPAKRIPSLAAIAFAMAASLSLSSCLTLSESMDALAAQAVSQGLLSSYQAAALAAAAKAANVAANPLTPEESYYVGRAVAARILMTYPPYKSDEINAYLGKLGQGLALYSSKPEVFAGYHFLALDSEEVNAFATPGGHVLVTRGMLRLARDEDELAAVLAHEISHVALGHGLKSVQGSRLTQIASEFAIDAGMSGDSGVASFTAAFGDSIAELASSLVISGYSITSEKEADLEARRMLQASGYDTEALERLVSRLPRGGADAKGFALTHPDPQSRLESLRSNPVEGKVKKSLSQYRIVPSPKEDSASGAGITPAALVRAERFQKARLFF